MNVLVTGATGFIGRRVTARLLEEGNGVTALLLPGEPETGMEGCTVRRGDITAPETLRGVMDGADAVIHLAGAVGYGQTMERCLAVNRDGTKNVATETVRAGIRRFLHMSSVSVYGRKPDVPIDEDFPVQKIGDPYGDTKIDAELILKDLGRRDLLDLTVVRPTVIYGPGDVQFLPKLVENLKSGKARMIGSGVNTVDLIHVNDVADFFIILLASPGAVGRTYNLTNPSNPTWKELLNFVAAELGLPPVEATIPYPAAYLVAGLLEFIHSFRGTPPRLTRYSVRVVGRQYRYLTGCAAKELGYLPKVALFDGLRECLGPWKR
jgi:nucleoside-diphosphate-sugar epimerase